MDTFYDPADDLLKIHTVTIASAEYNELKAARTKKDQDYLLALIDVTDRLIEYIPHFALQTDAFRELSEADRQFIREGLRGRRRYKELVEERRSIKEG